MAFFTVPILRILYTLGVGIVAIGLIGYCEFHSPPSAPKSHARHNAPPVGITEDAFDTGMPMDDDGPDGPPAKARTATPEPQSSAITDEPLAPEPATEAFDDGRPDALSGRAAAFDQWRKNNADLWDEMDSPMRTCVRARYINAHGISPEAGIDECLAFYSNSD